MTWTMLRNNLHADLQRNRLQPGRSGQLLANSGAGGTAYVTAPTAPPPPQALAHPTDALSNTAIDITGT